MLCRGIVVRDGEGRALRIAGSMTDITARKDLEERLASRGAVRFAYHAAEPQLCDRLAAPRHRARQAQQGPAVRRALSRLRPVQGRQRFARPPRRRSLLRLVAGRLNGCVRPGDVVARLGGDEFVVILEGVKDEAEAISVAERIQHSLAQPFYLDGRELFMSVSVGIAMSQPGLERPEDYLRDADLAMYRAKLRGRARHEVFRADMRAGAVLQMSLENDLRHSMDRGELRVMYQPIWSLASGPHRRIRGARALGSPGARRDAAGRLHPDRGRDRADPSDRRVGAARRRRSGSRIGTRSSSRTIRSG